MDNNKRKIKGFGWVYVIGTIVVIGGVMTYGAVASYFFNFDEDSALSMLAMIIPMSTIYYLAMRPIVKKLSSRIDTLASAMNEVSNGNLDYRIEDKKAGEFQLLYDQFNTMTLEIKKTKEEMEAFSNEFAHEFKTPITAISGFSDYLLQTADGVETEERKEQLLMISEESKRLLNLSMNTLLMSKLEATQIIVEKESYDLAEQIRKCVIILSKQLDEKEIELEMDEDLELPFYGNQELLQHVWLNLLNNAIKFTPKGGMITITGALKNDEVIVRINDSGVGMDAKVISKIFDKYYQNDDVSVARGNGIGLAIVKRVVDLCKGRIDVASMPGHGSTFTVTLPNKKVS